MRWPRFIVVAWLLSSSLVGAAWYNPSWSYRQKISIQPSLADEDLSGFPYLVRITNPANPVFANALANGYDIVFTSSDETTKIAHELELYDSGTGELYAWVRVPLISSTVPTDIYVYYGNGSVVTSEENVTGTWDDDFVMVQHLQETSGTHFDSTGNNNDGTPANGVDQNAVGLIDGADEFDGSNDKVDVPDAASLRVVEMTLEAWVYVPGSIPAGFDGILGHAPSTSNWYGLFKNSNRFHFRWSTGSVRRTDFASTFLPDRWYYVAGVLDVPGDEARTYQDDALDQTIGAPDPPTPATGPTYLGHTFPSSEFFKGFIDEVRISRIARSQAWVFASARNQREPDTYQTIGPPEVPPSAISGTVFEDVNYGGGAGVDYATALTRAGSFTIERPGVTVELYDSGGNHVSAVSPQITDASGNYSFTGITPGSYTVRVVNGSVTSTRAGSNGTELAVQTYRIDSLLESPGDGANKIGGEVPSNEDAAANSGAQTLASLQGTDLDADLITEWTQSIVMVDASAGGVTGVEFGFNFDTVVNTNDSGQGSLRQFVLNSNLLSILRRFDSETAEPTFEERGWTRSNKDRTAVSRSRSASPFVEERRRRVA